VYPYPDGGRRSDVASAQLQRPSATSGRTGRTIGTTRATTGRRRAVDLVCPDDPPPARVPPGELRAWRRRSATTHRVGAPAHDVTGHVFIDRRHAVVTHKLDHISPTVTNSTDRVESVVGVQCESKNPPP